MVAAPAAGAAETLPQVADVVAHARAVMDKKPQEVVCKVVVDTQLLDKTGKPEHDEHREGKATLRGDDQDVESSQVIRDGKAMSDAELADEHAKVQKDKRKAKKKGGDDDFDLSPLAAKNAANESFELRAQGDAVGPAGVRDQGARAEDVAAAGQRHLVDRRRALRRAQGRARRRRRCRRTPIGSRCRSSTCRGPKDVPVPSFLHIEGAGHMMFMHKQFRTTLRWSDCR